MTDSGSVGWGFESLRSHTGIVAQAGSQGPFLLYSSGAQYSLGAMHSFQYSMIFLIVFSSFS